MDQLSFVLLSTNSDVKSSIIDSILGNMLNTVFENVYNLTPVGSLGITIIIFTIFVKLLLLPLAVNQYTSSVKMQILQPEMKKIQDKYKGKKDVESQQQFSKEMSELYKKHNVHPLGGCLPLVIQLPIILALYKVLSHPSIYIKKLSDIYTQISTNIIASHDYQSILKPLLELKKIKNNSLSTTTDVQNLLGIFDTNNWHTLIQKLPQNIVDQISPLLQTKTHIEYFMGIKLIDNPGLVFPAIIIPILATVTTFISIKMTSNQNNQNDNLDETAKQLQNSMASMTYVFPALTFITTISLPAGLGLYWLVGNVFQIFQQLYFDYFLKPRAQGGISNELDRKTK